jgi:D-alanyl-D-alanine carboxypeptidase/D-alanyl-D-alanine-endopeptidase (penicillin-binding protein 4)
MSMIFSIRNTFIAIGLFCCTTGSFAQPQSTGNTTGTTAGQAAQTLAADETFRQSYVGIKVMTGAGDVLAAVNDEKTLVPASNMKLISTGAALFALGPEYRFSTEIAHDGHISEGTLHGNLYIVGGGDPTLGSKDTLATPLTATFEQWEKAIRSAGINRIEGRIIGDGRWLEGPAEDPTWQWGDLGTYYGTGLSGLAFYENMMSFSVSPGNATGEAVNIKPYYPSCSWMTFQYNCTTGEKGTGDKLYMYTSAFAPIAEIRGTYGLDRGTKRVDCSNKFPEYTCAVYFKNYLAQKGITCTGGAADFKLHCEWIPSDTPAERIGADADSLKVIGSSYSPSLRRIAFETNHDSNNLYAETLFRTLGKELKSSSCCDSSLFAMKAVLKQMHLSTSNGLFIQDGSGLSRQNLISADFFCRFLGAMMDSHCFEAFLWSLPYPGGDGTLNYNMKSYPESLRTRIRAKSGSMNGVRCYSGYILPEDYIPGSPVTQEIKDRTIIFSVMTNNCTSPNWKVRQMLDRFMGEIANSK